MAEHPTLTPKQSLEAWHAFVMDCSYDLTDDDDEAHFYRDGYEQGVHDEYRRLRALCNSHAQLLTACKAVLAEHYEGGIGLPTDLAGIVRGAVRASGESPD